MVFLEIGDPASWRAGCTYDTMTAMLLEILIQIVAPVFVLIGIGVLVNRAMPMDLGTLGRTTFHVLAPAVVFLKLANTELDMASLGIVAAFCLVHMGILMLVGWKLFSLRPFLTERPVLVMGAIFYNSGNYGFPFAQLAFGDYGVSVMAIILAVQVISNFTIGLWLVGAGGGNWRSIGREVLRVPLIYAIIIALGMNALHLSIPSFLSIPLKYLADGLIPIALLTLGVQLGRSKAIQNLPALVVSIVTRLFVSPLLAAGMAALCLLFLPEPFRQIAPVLVVGLGLPVAVNVYILAAEYDQQAEFASQTIFWTTLLSAFSLTGWLALLRVSP